MGIGGYHPGHAAPDAASSIDILEIRPLSTQTRNEWWNPFTPAHNAG